MAKFLTTKTVVASDAFRHSADRSLEKQDTLFTTVSEKQTSKSEQEGTTKPASIKENQKGISDSSEPEVALKVETLSRDIEDLKHEDCATTLPAKGRLALVSPGEMKCVKFFGLCCNLAQPTAQQLRSK